MISKDYAYLRMTPNPSLLEKRYSGERKAKMVVDMFLLSMQETLITLNTLRFEDGQLHAMVYIYIAEVQST